MKLIIKNYLIEYNMENSFLDINKNSMEFGFWAEGYKSVLIQIIERVYVTEVIRDWYISDVVINEKKYLIKWEKRIRPLTDEELKNKYGK